MAESSWKSGNSRSWTENSASPRNRRLALTVLSMMLLLTGGWFAYLAFSGSGMRIFATSLSETGYGKRLPHIEYGVLNPDELTQAATESGWIPWIWCNAEKKNAATREYISAQLSQLNEQLKDNGLQSHDTVIVHLRAHAVVYLAKSEPVVWECGLAIEESEDKTYPIRELMQGLRALRAKNVILIADIFDIVAAPNQALLVNPIRKYVMDACDDPSIKPAVSNQNLWILCSADDLQDSFYSNKIKKSLFQSAIEHGLKQASDNEDRTLSLREFYESILRYCHSASEGEQTPLLIHAKNAAQVCSPQKTKAIWNLADQVPVAVSRLHRVIPNSKTENSGKELEKTSKEPTSKAQAPQTKNDGNELTEENAELRFWQLRDQIYEASLVPNASWKWSPTIFSPLTWRRLQAEQARTRSSNSPKQKDRNQKLGLILGLGTENKALVGNELDDELVKDWEVFQNSQDGIKRMWEDEKLWSPDEWQQWIQNRVLLTKYTICLSELSQWRDLSLHASSNFGISTADYSVLVESLGRFKKMLRNPSEIKATSESFWDTRNVLHKQLEKTTNELIDAVSGRKKMNWIHEHHYQILQESPLLTYKLRKELKEAFGMLELDASYQEAKNASLETLIHPIEESNEAYRTRYNRFVGLLPLLGLQPMRASSFEELLNAGRFYRDELSGALARDKAFSPLDQWHLLSLIDIDFAPINVSSMHGIVVAPTDPRTLRIEVEPKPLRFLSNETQSITTVPIKFVDGSSVPECTVQFDFKSVPSGFKLFVNDRQVLPSKPTVVVDTSRNQFSIKGVLGNGAIRDDAAIRLSILHDGAKKLVPIAIAIVRDTPRLGLAVLRRNPGWEERIPMIETESSYRFDLSTPAVAGAYSQFSFELQNKEEKDRRARVRVFLIPTDTRQPQGRKIEIAASDPIELEKSVSRVSTKSFSLQKKQNAPLDEWDPNDSHLLFEVEELELKDANAKADTPERPKPNAVFAYSVYVVAKRPDPDKLYRIEPVGAIEYGQRIQFSIKSIEKEWEKVGLKQLPIQVIAKSKRFNQLLDETQVLEPKGPKSEWTVVGPVFQKDDPIWFEVSVGGYPRAFTMEANASSRRLVFRNTSQFYRPELKIDPIYRSRAEAKPTSINSKLILPNVTREGQQLQIDGLRFGLQLDIHSDQPAMMNFLKLPERKPIGEPLLIVNERTYYPSLSFNGELLQITGTTGELQINKRLDFLQQSSEFEVEFTCGETISQTVVVDRERPTADKVVCESSLRKGQSLDVSILADDPPPGSGVRSVEFSLSRSAAFERFGAPLLASQDAGNLRLWKALLSTESFANEPDGAQYYIFARIADAAGNSLEVEKPARITWKSK